jgi:nucleotide-binding universal stress UspA family protein
MAETELSLAELQEQRANRFRILVCVDGSEESYRGLRYAGDIGKHPDADIILLYVRPIDQGMRTGGLQVRVARENMLNWGLDLPGIKYLKMGLDRLIENGQIAEDWSSEFTHTDVDGDPLGDNKTVYTSPRNGRSVVLKLKVAPSVAVGILDQYELGPYNMIILGSSNKSGGIAKNFWDPAVAEKVAVHAPCSVCIARDLEVGHGQLFCTDGSDRAMDMLLKAGETSKRVGANVSVLSVALDQDGEAQAKANVEKAVQHLKSIGIEPVNAFTRMGNPVQEIIEAGKDYSFIVMGDTGRTGLKRFFMGSVAFKVMEYAENSVMIIR